MSGRLTLALAFCSIFLCSCGARFIPDENLEGIKSDIPGLALDIAGYYSQEMSEHKNCQQGDSYAAWAEAAEERDGTQVGRYSYRCYRNHARPE